MAKQEETWHVNNASKTFAKLFYYAYNLTNTVNENIDKDSQEYDTLPDLFLELSEAFTKTGGFMYTKEQALSLAYALTIFSNILDKLAVQSLQNDETKASLNIFHWAKEETEKIVKELEENHKNNKGGIISFDSDIGQKVEEL